MPLLPEAPEYTLEDIAIRIEATQAGNKNSSISGICPFEELLKGAVTFTRKLGIEKDQERLLEQKIGAVIVRDTPQFRSYEGPLSLFLCKDPLAAIVKLIPLFFEPAPAPAGISDKADIHPEAEIGKNVSIGAFVSIGAKASLEENVTIHPNAVIYPGARIGAGTIIHSGAVIREDCVISAGCVIQNNAVIGADGFGYFQTPEGLKPVPQVGNVELGPKVDIGANSAIDRGAFGSTRVQMGTKIDNLVQVGHNTQIGAHTILCGKVGVSGSCKIGSQVVLAGDVGVADHITIADNVRLGAKSGVMEDIKEKGDYAGFPARKRIKWLKVMKALQELPELLEKIKEQANE